MYYFLDHDDAECKELSIFGEEYTLLIDTCFRYSSCFSLNTGFLRRKGISFDIPKPYKMVANFKLQSTYPEMAILPCSKSTREYLVNRVNDLFEWIDLNNNPEDLTFYRQDGSIFFFSLIHEGVCCIANRQDEDVSEIVCNPYWHKWTEEDNANFYISEDLLDFRLEPNEEK